MNCPNCNHTLGAAHKFCAHCGLPLGDDSTIITGSGRYTTGEFGLRSVQQRPALLAGVIAVGLVLIGIIWMAAAANKAKIARQQEEGRLAQLAQSPPAGMSPAGYAMNPQIAPARTYQPPQITSRRNTYTAPAQPRQVAALPPIRGYAYAYTPQQYAYAAADIPPRVDLTDGVGNPERYKVIASGPQAPAYSGQPVKAPVPSSDPYLDSQRPTRWTSASYGPEVIEAGAASRARPGTPDYAAAAAASAPTDTTPIYQQPRSTAPGGGYFIQPRLNSNPAAVGAFGSPYGAAYQYQRPFGGY